MYSLNIQMTKLHKGAAPQDCLALSERTNDMNEFGVFQSRFYRKRLHGGYFGFDNSKSISSPTLTINFVGISQWQIALPSLRCKFVVRGEKISIIYRGIKILFIFTPRLTKKYIQHLYSYPLS